MTDRLTRIPLDLGPVDLETKTLETEEGPVRLTSREVALLGFLATRPGETISREDLHREIWGHSDRVISRAVDTAMARLRAKVERDARQPRHLITVHGVGFRFVPLEREQQATRHVIELAALTLDVDRAIATTFEGEVQLTATEAALLERLAETPGEAVDTEVLLDEVWDGTRTPKALYNAVHRLRAKLGPAPGGVPYIVSIRGGGFQLTQGDRHATEAPPLIGRLRELDAVGEAVDSASLVTLRGPGGVGKTHIARYFLTTRVLTYTGGTWFCDAHAAFDAEDLARVVARALRVPLAGDDSIGRIGAAVAARGPCLIVLDNLEQVTGAGEVITRWLAEAPDAHLLVTSRSPLDVPGETVIRIDPLPQQDAVNLFARRSREVRPDFDAEPFHDDIAQLVRRLDGLPLAVELAAARSRLLDPPTMLTRLDERFALLRERASTERTRFSTMRGALEWSWALLSEPARYAWAELSVFEGAAGLEACEAVLQPRGDDTVLDLVETLIDSSILTVETAATGTRYRMLETIRDYGRERAVELGVYGDARARRTGWLAGFGSEDEIEVLRSSRGPARRNLLLSHFDDFRAGLDEAHERGDWDDAARLALALVHSAVAVGPYSALAAYAGRVLDHGDLDVRTRLRLTYAKVVVLQSAGQRAEGHALARDGIALAREIGAIDLEVDLLAALGGNLTLQAADEAAELLETAVDLARQLGDGRRLGDTLNRYGIALYYQARVEEAEAAYNEAIALLRDVGEHGNLASTLGNQATMLHTQGFLVEAAEAYEDALTLLENIGNRRSRALFLGNLGNLHSELGDIDEARACYTESIDEHVAIGANGMTGIARANFGVFLLAQGAREEGRQQLEQAAELLSRVQNVFGLAFTLGVLGDLDRSQGQLKRARRRIAEAEALLRKGGYGLTLARVLCQRGRLDIDEGDLAAAREALREAEALCNTASVEATSEIFEHLAGLRNALGVTT